MKQKLVVISGASKGLGLHLAKLIENDATKVIKLGLKTPGNVDFRCDLTKRMSTFECISEVREKFGEIDLLISNAGGGKRPAETQNAELLQEYFNDLNYVTARNLIEASLPSLRISKGSVIAISSIAALKKISDAPNEYSTAKKKLNKYVRMLAKREAKNGVRANIVSPGNVLFENSRWAELIEEKPDFVVKKIKSEVPLGSFISPVEIASAISFLTSKEAINITGANIVIDGGQSL